MKHQNCPATNQILARTMMTMYEDSMRISIELPNEQLEALENLCVQENVSRAELIRRAVGDYLQVNQAGKGKNAFGLWKKKKVNTLEYEAKLCAEWDKR